MWKPGDSHCQLQLHYQSLQTNEFAVLSVLHMQVSLVGKVAINHISVILEA